MKAHLVNRVLLFVITLLGTQKRHINPLKNLIDDCAINFLTDSTSGHFVILSIAMYRNSKPLVAWGKGLKMSSPQTTKGQDKGMVCKA